MSNRRTHGKFGSIDWKHPFAVHGKESEERKEEPKRKNLAQREKRASLRKIKGCYIVLLK